MVYAVDGDVVVRVPQRHRISDIFTPEEVARPDAETRSAVERYLIADDWRAIAMGRTGKLGIVSGRGSEEQAVSDALAACSAAGGVDCRLVAIGPFVVDPG
jgi:adenylate cyclase